MTKKSNGKWYYLDAFGNIVKDCEFYIGGINQVVILKEKNDNGWCRGEYLKGFRYFRAAI